MSKHYVYRCYDAADRLLYIGCTRDVNARLMVHGSQWDNPASAALNLRMDRYEVVEYPDKESGREAERRAIYNEAPLFNHLHQKARRTREQRRADIDAYLRATEPEPDLELRAQLIEVLSSFAAPRSA